MKTTEQVSSLINCLTNDEDLRQDLWVHYLSGNHTDSFSDQLDKLTSDYSDDLKVKHALWQLIKNPPTGRFADILKEFTDFERSIMCMLAIGLTIDKIAAYKGINQVRIRQAISSIRYNCSWDKHYGIKETLNR